MRARFKQAFSDIDWSITILPLVIIGVVSALLMLLPDGSKRVIETINAFFIDDLGFIYILFGLFVLGVSFYLIGSRHGKIKLGTLEKPRYSNYKWASLIFTSVFGADLLFWALIEWGYYYNAAPLNMDLTNMGLAAQQEWASTYPLFHWGMIPWAVYLVPAVIFGYMLFNDRRKRQTYSEACRPILGRFTDRWPGKAIDLFVVVALILATSTTFSVTTPLMTQLVGSLTGLPANQLVTVFILAVIAVIYTVTVVIGMKGISKLAGWCTNLFLFMMLYFLFFGPTRYIVETSITSIGNVFQNFLRMATWLDPLRLSQTAASPVGFPQNWTVFYWAYWIAWAVATPFFIGKISEGRTIKNTLIGGFLSGLSGTYVAFCVFSNFSLYQQVTGQVDAAGALIAGGNPHEIILQTFQKIPFPDFAMVVLLLTMVLFYATTFDAISLIIAGYSQKKLDRDGEPKKGLRAYWSVIFILLPIALIFAESTLENLKTLSIVAALPMMLIIGAIIIAFLRRLKRRELGPERADLVLPPDPDDAEGAET